MEKEYYANVSVSMSVLAENENEAVQTVAQILKDIYAAPKVTRAKSSEIYVCDFKEEYMEDTDDDDD